MEGGDIKTAGKLFPNVNKLDNNQHEGTNEIYFLITIAKIEGGKNCEDENERGGKINTERKKTRQRFFYGILRVGRWKVTEKKVKQILTFMLQNLQLLPGFEKRKKFNLFTVKM